MQEYRNLKSRNGVVNRVKKIAYTMTALCLLGLGQTANAQITLEHTFDGYVVFASSWSLPYSYCGDAEFFIDNHSEINQIKLYNTDYSVYKNINIIPPVGYDFYSGDVYYFTKELFNNDNKIEFVAFFYKQGEEGENIMRIYNEEGTILKDFVDVDNFEVFKVNEQYKLLLSHYNSGNVTTEIYSLPGKTTSVAPMVSNTISKSPYPNPTNTTITLPYKLKQGETSTMHIYSINGQLIETKQIDSGYDKILLNVSGYTKGMYIYEVNGVNNRFVVR